MLLELFYVKQLFIFCVGVVWRCKSGGKIFWELFHIKHFPVVMGYVYGMGMVTWVGSWEVGWMCGMDVWDGYNCLTSNTSYLRFSYKTIHIFIRVKSCAFQTHA